MFRLPLLLCILSALALPQGRGPAPAATTPGMTPTLNREFVRENYTKFEYRIPMRDGVKLFTSVYVPKDAFSATERIR